MWQPSVELVAGEGTWCNKLREVGHQQFQLIDLAPKIAQSGVSSSFIAKYNALVLDTNDS